MLLPGRCTGLLREIENVSRHALKMYLVPGSVAA